MFLQQQIQTHNKNNCWMCHSLSDTCHIIGELAICCSPTFLSANFNNFLLMNEIFYSRVLEYEWRKWKEAFQGSQC
jgi:hypothetical protein